MTSGTKGKRFALPNSRVMIHQPTGGAPAVRILRHFDPGPGNPALAPAPSARSSPAVLGQGGPTKSTRTPTAIPICPPRRPKDYGLVDHVIEGKRGSSRSLKGRRLIF
ncbi:MAG: ATP-dependent Clp protease proteolytic subunit [Desulfobacterales bacterium]|nr:ATP-dependent Clp protease proteolytic subunit [Desulfobacterales bacterium]